MKDRADRISSGNTRRSVVVQAQGDWHPSMTFETAYNGGHKDEVPGTEEHLQVNKHC